MTMRRHLPFAVALLFGLLALIGLLLGFAPIRDLVMNWASFLATVALLLGVLNLFAVHLDRLVSGRNFNSGILVISMLVVFLLAITDSAAVNVTERGVQTAFDWFQAPLEAALASLMAFFLLFAGVRLFQRQRNLWSLLFLLTAVLILLSNALGASALIPAGVASLLVEMRSLVDGILVTAGMRGILIGVALGTIAISIRLLIGLDRPYS